MDGWADKHGLSEGRLRVLWALKAAPERQLPLGELADQLEVTPRNVTGLIDHLERDGLVERIDDPADRRLTYARLTMAGGQRPARTREGGVGGQAGKAGSPSPRAGASRPTPRRSSTNKQRVSHRPT